MKFYLFSPLIAIVLLVLINAIVFTNVRPFAVSWTVSYVVIFFMNVIFILKDGIAKFLVAFFLKNYIVMMVTICILWLCYIWMLSDIFSPIDDLEYRIIIVSAIPSFLVDLLTIVLCFQKHKLLKL